MEAGLRRHPTKAELDVEKLPNCSYDLLGVTTCTKYREPTRKECEDCLVRVVVDALEDKNVAEAMHWFISLEYFRKKKEK
jgi:hypothetical protein